MKNSVLASDSSAARQVAAALLAVRDCAGENLSAGYLLGSALTGGLQAHSDIDLLFVIRQPLSIESRRQLTSQLLAISAPPGHPQGRPLEVTLLLASQLDPWRYPPMCEYQFGEWLRPELEAGQLILARSDPDLVILLATVRQESETLLGPPATERFPVRPAADLSRAIAGTLPDIVAGWRGDERNALLALCRMWVTLETGQIVSKDRAAAWALVRLPDTHLPIVECARADYLGRQRPDWRALQGQVEAAVGDLRGRVKDALDHPRSRP